MAGIRLWNVHYVWEDIVSMALGAVVVLTSWLLGEPHSEAAAINAVIVGLAIMALGAAEFVDLRRWEELLETACGLWLVASPFVLGYAGAGTLRYWHFALGAAAVLVALLELRQDWTRSPADLAGHSVR